MAADGRLYWSAALRGCPQRVNHAAVALGAHVYSFGGYCSSRSRRMWHRSRMDVLRLNLHTLRWTDVTDSTSCREPGDHAQPQVRYGHSAVGYGDRAFVFGGRNDASVAPPHVCEFDPAALSWTVHAGQGHVPLGRDGHAACVVQHRMLVFGGFTSDEEYDDKVYSCDLHQMHWTWLRPSTEAPSPRDFCCCAAWGSGFFLWGGRSDESGAVHSGQPRYDSGFHFFDADACSWSQVQAGPLPVGRRSGVMFRLLDGLYFGFGFRDSGAEDGHLGDLWRLDVGSGRVAPAAANAALSRGPCARRRLAAVPVGGSRALLFGGTCCAYSFRPPVDACSFRRLYAPLLPSLPALRFVADRPPTAAAAAAKACSLQLSAQDGPARRDEFLRELEEPDDSSLGLKDISDMFLLDADPSLQTLCAIAIIRHRLPLHALHSLLQEDIVSRVTDNNISPVE